MPDSSPPAEGDLRSLPADRVARFDEGLAPVLARYPADRKASAMIPALRLGQELFGHLSPAVMALAADRLGVSPARAEEVASFYVMLHTRPVGRHVLEICTNVSCSLCGSERLFDRLRERLGLENGGTTADGRITLREVECLGSCGTGPAMLVDDEMVERLTEEKLERVLGELA